MLKPRQRAVYILGLQHQSGRCGSRTSGRTRSRLIRSTVRFHNFREALDFVQEVGELAETEGHHPDISFGWGYATVSLSTKKIKGMHENDFIMASKIDRLLDRRKHPAMHLVR